MHVDRSILKPLPSFTILNFFVSSPYTSFSTASMLSLRFTAFLTLMASALILAAPTDQREQQQDPYRNALKDYGQSDNTEGPTHRRRALNLKWLGPAKHPSRLHRQPP